MASDRFDPSGYFTFDLARGRASTETTDVLVLPVELLGQLADEAENATLSRLARGLGEWLGKRVRDRLSAGGADPLAASPEAFLNQLNGLLAVHGLGRTALETFGDVLLLRLDSNPLGAAHGTTFVEALFSGVITTFLGEEARCLAIETPAGQSLLVASPSAIRRASAMRSAGVTGEAIVTRLCQEARVAIEERK